MSIDDCFSLDKLLKTPEVALLVLCVAILPKRIPGFPPVSGENVQISVQTEQQLASVVVCSWFFDFQNDPECQKKKGSVELLIY